MPRLPILLALALGASLVLPGAAAAAPVTLRLEGPSGHAWRADHETLRVIGGSAADLWPVGFVWLAADDTAPRVTLSVKNDAVWQRDRTAVLLFDRRHGPGASIVLHVVDDDPRPAAPHPALRVASRWRLRRALRFSAACDIARRLTAHLHIDAATARRLRAPGRGSAPTRRAPDVRARTEGVARASPCPGSTRGRGLRRTRSRPDGRRAPHARPLNASCPPA